MKTRDSKMTPKSRLDQEDEGDIDIDEKKVPRKENEADNRKTIMTRK